MSRERILEVVLTCSARCCCSLQRQANIPTAFTWCSGLSSLLAQFIGRGECTRQAPRAWTWMFVAVALLLNPFLPIRMQRAQWQPIDLYLGILLIGWSGYWLFRKQTPTSSQNGQAHQTPQPVTKAGTSAGGTGASTGTSGASPRENSSAIPKRTSDPTPEWQMWIPEWPRPLGQDGQKLADSGGDCNCWPTSWPRPCRR